MVEGILVKIGLFYHVVHMWNMCYMPVFMIYYKNCVDFFAIFFPYTKMSTILCSTILPSFWREKYLSNKLIKIHFGLTSKIMKRFKIKFIFIQYYLGKMKFKRKYGYNNKPLKISVYLYTIKWINIWMVKLFS